MPMQQLLDSFGPVQLANRDELFEESLMARSVAWRKLLSLVAGSAAIHDPEHFGTYEAWIRDKYREAEQRSTHKKPLNMNAGVDTSKVRVPGAGEIVYLGVISALASVGFDQLLRGVREDVGRSGVNMRKQIVTHPYHQPFAHGGNSSDKHGYTTSLKPVPLLIDSLAQRVFEHAWMTGEHFKNHFEDDENRAFRNVWDTAEHLYSQSTRVALDFDDVPTKLADMLAQNTMTGLWLFVPALQVLSEGSRCKSVTEVQQRLLDSLPQALFDVSGYAKHLVTRVQEHWQMQPEGAEPPKSVGGMPLPPLFKRSSDGVAGFYGEGESEKCIGRECHELPDGRKLLPPTEAIGTALAYLGPVEVHRTLSTHHKGAPPFTDGFGTPIDVTNIAEMLGVSRGAYQGLA